MLPRMRVEVPLTQPLESELPRDGISPLPALAGSLPASGLTLSCLRGVGRASSSLSISRSELAAPWAIPPPPAGSESVGSQAPSSWRPGARLPPSLPLGSWPHGGGGFVSWQRGVDSGTSRSSACAVRGSPPWILSCLMPAQ